MGVYGSGLEEQGETHKEEGPEHAEHDASVSASSEQGEVKIAGPGPKTQKKAQIPPPSPAHTRSMSQQKNTFKPLKS